jgi:hypothetical protein
MTRYSSCARLLVIAILIVDSNACVHSQASESTGPSEQLVSFSPSEGSILVKGAPLSFTANVVLSPSTSESVKYVARLTVNRRRYRPFTTTLTQSTAQGSVNGTETITWDTRVLGPKHMTVRLDLSGIGQSSGVHFKFAEIRRIYSVKCNSKQWWPLRKLETLFGCCSQ